jgi:signal transduction histidine kinase
MPPSLLSVRSLSKQYGNLKVLDGVGFEVHQGEILGLVGRRGAGKSTLLELLSGGTPPSDGAIYLEGTLLHLASRRHAFQHGIELIAQTPQVVQEMDVLENIYLGRELQRDPILRMPARDEMRQDVVRLMSELDIPRSLLGEPVHEMTDEQQQLVSILRAFSHASKLLLVDDVLSTLSFFYQQLVLGHILKQANLGLGAIICSDNLKHLFNVTDRILVLYQGRQVADLKTSDCTPREIVELIVGSTNQNRVTPVIWALENYQAAQEQAEKLFRRQAELHEDLEATESLNRELIVRLRRQVAASDRLNAALQQAQRRLLTEREEERKALARDIHDLVIQDLLSINYRLEETEGENTPVQQRTELGAVRDSIRDVIADLRRLCRDLRPPTIDNHGLPSAIRSHVEEWELRTGIAVEMKVDPSFGRLPETTEISVFRIIQEGLNNIAKHAEASHVVLTLRRTASDNLLVRIVDDGKGSMDAPDLMQLSQNDHFGLIGVSERAALLGGSMEVETLEEGGFALEIKIPSPYPSA